MSKTDSKIESSSIQQVSSYNVASELQFPGFLDSSFYYKQLPKLKSNSCKRHTTQFFIEQEVQTFSIPSLQCPRGQVLWSQRNCSNSLSLYYYIIHALWIQGHEYSHSNIFLTSLHRCGYMQVERKFCHNLSDLFTIVGYKPVKSRFGRFFSQPIYHTNCNFETV